MKAPATIITIATTIALLAPAANAMYYRSVNNHKHLTTATTKKTTIAPNHYQVFRNTWGLRAL
jgi:hypothetical protein